MLFYLLVNFVKWLWGIHGIDSITQDMFAMISFFEIIYVGGVIINYFVDRYESKHNKEGANEDRQIDL